jgi:hypothetical protein
MISGLTRDLPQLLEAAPKNKRLEKALFAHANGITERFFGDEIGYRGYALLFPATPFVGHGIHFPGLPRLLWCSAD